MRAIGVIPVRYDSKRYPGKALAKIGGKPLIQNTYERASKSLLLDEVVIATDDKRIYDAASSFGAPVVITPKKYVCGTERVADAVSCLNCGIILNIQGDQPFIRYEMIDEAVSRMLAEPRIDVLTPVYPVWDRDALLSRDIVKVVIDKKGYAMYFSRSLIPCTGNREKDIVFYKHIGVYAYRKNFLKKYALLGPSVLEEAEGLEQLRILENGGRIMTIKSAYDSPSVDTEEDLRLLENQRRGWR